MVTPCLHHTPAPAPLSGWLDGMILTVHRHSVTSEDVEPQCELSGCRDRVSSYRGGQAMVLVVTEVVKTVWPVNMLPHSEGCRAVAWDLFSLTSHSVSSDVKPHSVSYQVVKPNVSLPGCQVKCEFVRLSSLSVSSDVEPHDVSCHVIKP